MANQNDIIGAYGSYHLGSTAAIVGKYQTVIVQEDSTQFTTLQQATGDSTADYLTVGNYSGASLKKGAVVTSPSYFKRIALTSGSVIVYNKL